MKWPMTKLRQGASPRSSCGGEQQSSRSTSVQLTLNKAQVIEQGSYWKKRLPGEIPKGTWLMKQNPAQQMGCSEIKSGTCTNYKPVSQISQICNLAWSLVFPYVSLDSSDEQICRWKGYDPTSHTIEGMARADVLITSLSSLSWTAAVLNPGLVLHPSPARKASPKATHLAFGRRVMRVGMMRKYQEYDGRWNICSIAMYRACRIFIVDSW